MKDLSRTILAELWKRTRQSKTKELRPSSIVAMLSRNLGLDPFDVQVGLAKLQKDGSISGVSPKGEPYMMVKVLEEPPAPSVSDSYRNWLDVIRSSPLSAFEKGLLKCAPAVEGLSLADMQILLRQLHALSQAEHDAGEDPYIVSARNIMGSSKALDVFAGAIGLRKEQLGQRPVYVVMAGPAQPKAVVFIENPASFEEFCSSAAIKSAVAVITFGFSMAWAGIAEAIPAGRAIYLKRCGNPPELRMITTVPWFFWGDLDLAGLDIFLSMKSQLPSLQLSALYTPMIAALRSEETSHPYCKFAEKDRQSVPTFDRIRDDELVHQLRRLCARRAVDQEIVTAGEIEFLALRGLNEVEII